MIAQEQNAWLVAVVTNDDSRYEERARVADLLLELRREDQHDRESPCAGEAHLVVLPTAAAR